MNKALTDNAARLYVFVDTVHQKSTNPRTVIIGKQKAIRDLRHEFEKLNYEAEEQHWVMNNMYCYDDFQISELIANVPSFNNGYVAFLYIMPIEEKEGCNMYFGTYVEQKYLNVKLKDRWREPKGPLVIIADVIDPNKLKEPVGWTCTACTFINKAYLDCCTVCGQFRPEDYKMPDKIFWTQEDRKQMIENQQRKILEEQREKEFKIKLEQEKKENLEKLKLMYKEDLVFTTDVSECPICGDDIPPGEAVILRNCFHTICKTCIKDYVTTIDNPEVKCFVPDCVGFITHQELQGILNEEEFEKYQQLSLRTAESKTQNTFHCKTPNCTAWIVFDDGVNFFPCPLCKKENCLLCGAIHEGQSCKEYQDELAIKARNDEAAKKDMAFLQNLIDTGQAMKCPGCQIIVQKKSGCDWMQCNMCKTEICWATKGPRWGPKGHGDTNGGCGCKGMLRRCHPKCGNCH